jgi:hypothetical protein
MMSDAIGQSIQQGAVLAGIRVIGGFERILVQFVLSELVREPCGNFQASCRLDA